MSILLPWTWTLQSSQPVTMTLIFPPGSRNIDQQVANRGSGRVADSPDPGGLPNHHISELGAPLRVPSSFEKRYLCSLDTRFSWQKTSLPIQCLRFYFSTLMWAWRWQLGGRQ